ncbi:MAG: CBS domain-containing protein [Proteobacteria bacterium]|nr:MAG: CBS domain-containing protein [Pseudomonadota bacterium]
MGWPALEVKRGSPYPRGMNTTARDIMSAKLIVAKQGMNIEDAVKLLVNNKVTGLPVVDGTGRMVGILSEYDIIARVGREKDLSPALFKDGIPYSTKVESVREDTSLSDILNRFIELKCRRLPVLDASDRLVGIISRRDVMKVLYYRAKLA